MEVAEAGLEAIDTEKVMRDAVGVKDDHLVIRDERFSLGGVKRILVVGVGKCSFGAGAAIEEILGERLTGGIVVGVSEGKLQKIEVFRGTHPLPTEVNVRATKEIIKLLSGANENDFIIFAISGGGSTLLCQPKNLVCKEEAAVFRCLSEAGADIKEMNTLRKHVSVGRGGYLAKYAYPARSVALIFSDIPGDDLGFVASGPTVKDLSTVRDAERIVKKYNLDGKCGFPPDAIIETPKDDKYFGNVKNILLVSNRIALQAMAEKAKKLGFTARIAATALTGRAKEVGEEIVHELSRCGRREILLYGGETTVRLANPNGKGGRNMDLVLSALRRIGEGQVIASIASDGRDNSDFGGAICDKITGDRARKLNLNPEVFLDRNTSYEFFDKVGDYLLLGDTGSNVSDLVVALNF